MGSTSIRWDPARLIQLYRLPGRRPIRARRRVLRFDIGRQRLRVQRTHARDVSRQSHARARGVHRRRRRSREPAVESAARYLLAGIGDAVGAAVAAGHDGDNVRRRSTAHGARGGWSRNADRHRICSRRPNLRRRAPRTRAGRRPNGCAARSGADPRRRTVIVW